MATLTTYNIDDLVDNFKQSLEDLISDTQSKTESAASIADSFDTAVFSTQTPTKALIQNTPYTTTITGQNLDNYPLASITGIALSAKENDVITGVRTYAETLIFTASKPLKPALYLTDGFTIGSVKISESIKLGTYIYSNKNSFTGEITIGASGAFDHLMIKNVALSVSEKEGATSYAQTLSLVSDSGVNATLSTGSGIFKTVKFTTAAKDNGISNTHSFNGTNLALGDALSQMLNSELSNDELKSLLLAGNDKITGTVGADTLSGGAGYDLLIGGKGSDSFAFSAEDSAIDSAFKQFDTIKDFKYSDALGEHDTLQFDLLTKNFVSRESTAVKTLALAQTDANAQMANGSNIVFELVGKTGYVFVDYDGDHTADSLIKLTNVKTLSSQSITIPVDTGAPTFTSGSSASTVDENSGAGQIIYTASANDLHSLTYALKAIGDYALLNIDPSSGEVSLTANPDYESKSTYNFTVIATDTSLNASEQAVNVIIANLDEVAPAITSGTTATVAENAPISTVIYTAASDDTADISAGVTYSLGGDDMALLNINSTTGVVTLKTGANYETKNGYAFTVIADDGINTPSTKDVVISIVNLDEVAPTITSGNTAQAINENSGVGQTIYTATSDDTTDYLSGSTTYTLKAVDDYTDFTIDGSTGAVTLTANPDFELKSTYAFTVIATDTAQNAREQAITLAINDLDEIAPVFSSLLTATAPENVLTSTTLYDATADADTGVTYTFAGGSDDSLFNLNAITGAVTFKISPNFEIPSDAGANNVYDFTIRASDTAGNHTDQSVALTVTDVTEITDTTPPVFTSGSSASAKAENSGAGQTIYTATATDTATITYSLKHTGDYTALGINATSGAVTLTANPNYETKSTYSFTIIATDTFLNASEKAITLAINNLDEIAPTFTSGATASTPENVLTLTAVYTATSTDSADIATGATTYSFNTAGGADHALFNLNTVTGAVTFKTSPDYEAPTDTGANNVYNFTITATDAAGNHTDQGVALGVTDVNENTYTAGQSVIDLGEYGKLIAPVQVDGKWFYVWDMNGDGTHDWNQDASGQYYYDGSIANAGGSGYQYDFATHDVLDGLFNHDINGLTNTTVLNYDGAYGTTNDYRYATINGVQVALPTIGTGNMVENGWYYLNDNQTYTDLAEIWDTYNTGAGTSGTPAGWQAVIYWSATPSDYGHAFVDTFVGSVYGDTGGDDSDGDYVALQVL